MNTPKHLLRASASAIVDVINVLRNYEDPETQEVLESLTEAAVELDHLHNGVLAAEIVQRREGT